MHKGHDMGENFEYYHAILVQIKNIEIFTQS